MVIRSHAICGKCALLGKSGLSAFVVEALFFVVIDEAVYCVVRL